MDDTQSADSGVTLAAQLGGIWCVRDISDAKRDTETTKAILNSVNGHDDACTWFSYSIDRRVTTYHR